MGGVRKGGCGWEVGGGVWGCGGREGGGGARGVVGFLFLMGRGPPRCTLVAESTRFRAGGVAARRSCGVWQLLCVAGAVWWLRCGGVVVWGRRDVGESGYGEVMV